MQNTTINSSPKLALTEPELLDVGVMLQTIQLKSHQEKVPPFKATIFEVAPGCSSPVDQHRVEECWIILKGCGVLDYNNEQYFAKSQEVFYFEPYHSHQIINNSDESLLICSIYW